MAFFAESKIDIHLVNFINYQREKAARTEETPADAGQWNATGERQQ